MSTTSSVTTDISVKYQRLASEFVKLRSQVSVLKTGVIEEQKKSANFQEELAEKEIVLRKFQDENEGLLFRNCQLLKRVELLQKSLDEVNKLQAAKGKKKQKDANLRLFVDFTDQPTNIAGTSAGVDRRQLFEQEFERQQILISELESKISVIHDDHEKVINELNGKLAAAEAENQCLKQKLEEPEEMQLRRKGSIRENRAEVNGVIDMASSNDDLLPKQNGYMKEQSIDPPTAEVAIDLPEKEDSAPSRILTDHTKRLFEEANRLKAEWESGVVALEHELEVMRKWRDDQTSAADSIDPETKTREKSLISFFKEKIKQLTTDLRFAQGEASYYKDECEALLSGTKTLLESRSDTASCQNCASLKELLDDTRNTFEYQMRQLYDQINEQESHLLEHKEQISKLTGGSSSSQTKDNLFKQGLLRIASNKKTG